MLTVNTYTKDYINACHATIDAQIENYNHLIATVKEEHVTNEKLDAAIATFEPVFFNNLLVLLDNYFVYRSRSIEEKDGNALNEVRVMSQSIMHNNNKMGTDDTIKPDPAKSVLQYQTGDEIRLNETNFIKLSNAFLNEIESKYVQQ